MRSRELYGRLAILASCTSVAACDALFRLDTLEIAADAPAAITTHWSSTDRSASITLSNDDRDAFDGDVGQAGVRSVLPQSFGKWYAKLTVVRTASVPAFVVGIANAAWLRDTTLLGLDASSLGYSATSGNLLYRGCSIDNLGPVSSGSTIELAVDLDTRLAWIRLDGGSWNHNATSDPASGVAGESFPGISPPTFLAFSSNQLGNLVSIAATAGNPPSGFEIW